MLGLRRSPILHGSTVIVIDVDSLKVVREVPNCPGMGGLAVAPELNRGFTVNGTTTP